LMSILSQVLVALQRFTEISAGGLPFPDSHP
jgi:hypothetical protein